MDRFLPMPDGIQIKGIWGTDSVLNRYVDNGNQLYPAGQKLYCDQTDRTGTETGIRYRRV